MLAISLKTGHLIKTMIMRKILLLTVLIAGFYLPAFTQHNNLSQNNRFVIDTTFSKLSLKNNSKVPDLVISYDTNWLFNHSGNYKKTINPELPGHNPKLKQDPMAVFQMPPTSGNMPCVVPQGYFPMPMLEPDTTVRYSLLIKKY